MHVDLFYLLKQSLTLASCHLSTICVQARPILTSHVNKVMESSIFVISSCFWGEADTLLIAFHSFNMTSAVFAPLTL